jgi:sec-independent protein translocase protein TatA
MQSYLFNDFGFIQNLNGFEIFAILFIVLLLFGAKRLPELSRSLGKSMREFKKATSEIENEIKSSIDETPVTKNDSQKVKTEEKDHAESKA